MLGPFSKPVVLVADVGSTRDIIAKSDFDRSIYVIDRFPLFGGSQIIKSTDQEWRTSRTWLKDLLTPHYLQSVLAPHVHTTIQDLIKLWSLSTDVVGPGKSFDMQHDLKILALDVMTQFHHGEHFLESALKSQIRHVEQLQGKDSKLEVGPSNSVTLSHIPATTFGEAVMGIADKMGAIYTGSLPPKLISLWTRYMVPRYRDHFAAKQRYMRQSFNASVERLRHGEEPVSAIDHMVNREIKVAQKADRTPMYKGEVMIDEVSTHQVHCTTTRHLFVIYH